MLIRQLFTVLLMTVLPLTARARETLRIGTALQPYPYVYECDEPGKDGVCGLEADLVRWVCKEAGYSCKFVRHALSKPAQKITDEGGLLYDLNVPEAPYDLAMNAISANAGRRGSFLFSMPYFTPQHILLTKMTGLKGQGELNSDGFITDKPRAFLKRPLKIGTYEGFLMDELRHAYPNPQNIELVPVKKSIEDALVQGDVDVVLAWTGVDKAVQRRDASGGFFRLSAVPTLAADPFEGIALAARKDDARMGEVMRRLNQAIRHSRNPRGRDGGEYRALCEKYLGSGVDIWPGDRVRKPDSAKKSH